MKSSPSIPYTHDGLPQPNTVRVLHWTDANGVKAKCHIRVYHRFLKIVVVATEMIDNPGGSITNEAARLWPEIHRQFNFSPVKTVCIEHYPLDPDVAARDGSLKQSPYDRVIIEFDKVSWRPLSIDEVLMMIGGNK